MLKENTKDENEGIIQRGKREKDQKRSGKGDKHNAQRNKKLSGNKKDRRDFIILNVSCS